MKNLLHSAKFLALDMASTLVLLAVLKLTGSITIAACIGIAIALAQVGYDLLRRKPVHALLWLSLVVVVSSGAAMLFTQDARFLMIKPSVVSVAFGLTMLKPGWMDRYLPQDALTYVPDIAVIFGYVWAASQFIAAGVNIVVALNVNPLAWATIMSAYHMGTMIGLFAIQYAVMRIIGRRRHNRGLDVTSADGVLAAQA